MVHEILLVGCLDYFLILQRCNRGYFVAPITSFVSGLESTLNETQLLVADYDGNFVKGRPSAVFGYDVKNFTQVSCVTGNSGKFR